MAALCSRTNIVGFDRIILQKSDPSGVYAFAFEQTSSPLPEWDYFLEDWDQAKGFCAERWGVPLDSWVATDEHPDPD